MQVYQNIGRNANAALGAAQDRRGGLASIGAIQQGSNDASLGLAVADAQARMSNIKNLMQQNNVMTQYRDKAWQWNQQEKFQENAAAIRALKAASNQNINNGIQGATSIGLNALEQARSGSKKSKEWDKIMTEFRGNNGTSTWNTASALPINDFRIPGNSSTRFYSLSLVELYSEVKKLTMKLRH